MSFVVIVQGDKSITDQIIAAVCSKWTDEGIIGISVFFSSISHDKGEESLLLLNRLDDEAPQELRV